MYTVNGMKKKQLFVSYSCYTVIGLCGKRYGKTSSPLTLSQCFIYATQVLDHEIPLAKLFH